MYILESAKLCNTCCRFDQQNEGLIQHISLCLTVISKLLKLLQHSGDEPHQDSKSRTKCVIVNILASTLRAPNLALAQQKALYFAISIAQFPLNMYDEVRDHTALCRQYHPSVIKLQVEHNFYIQRTRAYPKFQRICS